MHAKRQVSRRVPDGRGCFKKSIRSGRLTAGGPTTTGSSFPRPTVRTVGLDTWAIQQALEPSGPLSMRSATTLVCSTHPAHLGASSSMSIWTIPTVPRAALRSGRIQFSDRKGRKEGGAFYDVMSYCGPSRISRWGAATDMEPPEIIPNPMLPSWADSPQRRHTRGAYRLAGADEPRRYLVEGGDRRGIPEASWPWRDSLLGNSQHHSSWAKARPTLSIARPTLSGSY